MAKSKEWKQHRDHVLPGRMAYTKRILHSIGVHDFKEEGYNLIINYKDIAIRYSPFTGCFTGKKIGNGRGLDVLISKLP